MTSILLRSSLDFSSFIGRIAVGRLQRGTLKSGQQLSLIKRDGSETKHRLKELYVFEGLGKAKVDSVQAGDICALVGLEGFEINEGVAVLCWNREMLVLRISDFKGSAIWNLVLGGWA